MRSLGYMNFFFFTTMADGSSLCIISSSGTGAVYSFDPVGSYEREICRAAGAAQSLIQPFLDNQVSSTRLISSEAIKGGSRALRALVE